MSADLEKLLADMPEGGWFVGEKDDFDESFPVLYDIGRVPVANIPDGYSDRNGASNARLISMAPDLARQVIALTAENAALRAKAEKLAEAME